MEPFTPADHTDHGPPDPIGDVTFIRDCQAELSAIDQEIQRSLSILTTLTIQCCECRRYGPAINDHFRWQVEYGKIYCLPCSQAEGIG
jgi:hypothetical protein